MIDLSIFDSPLSRIIGLDDSRAAYILNKRMLAIEGVEKLWKQAYSERGMIAAEFQRRELYKHLGFETFSDWMASGFAGSRASIYEAKRDIESLNGNIPADKLRNIGRQNLKTLCGCSTAVQANPDVQAAAAELSPKEFVAHIAEKHPEQHVEQRVKVVFRVDESAVSVLEDALKATMEHEHLTSREQALEAWAAEAMDRYSEATS